MKTPLQCFIGRQKNLLKGIVSIICAFLLPFTYGVSEGSSVDQSANAYLSSIKRITANDGLPATTIFSLASDRDGFIWLGTPTRLIRYDGYEFRDFSTADNNGNALVVSKSDNIYIDSKNRIWIGTWGQGLAVYDMQMSLLHHFLHDKSDSSSISSDKIQVIYEDKTGKIWLGTNGGGLSLFNEKEFNFRNHLHDPKVSSSISHNRVWSIAQDHTGALWVATTNGLNRFSEETQSFERFYADPHREGAISHNLVRSVLVDREGRLWVGTQKGFERFDVKTDKFSTIKLINPSGNAIVTKITQGNKGQIYIATLQGLYRYDPKLGQLMPWAGEGVYRIFERSDIRDVLFDTGGLMWVATRFGGLIKVDLTPNRFEHFDSYSSAGKSKKINRVYALFQDSQQILWIGSNNGLLRFDQQNGKISRLELPNHEWRDRVISIVEDQDRNLWIGGSNGIQSINKSRTSITNREDILAGIPTKNVNKLFIDSENHLWVGLVHDGLIRYELSGKRDWYQFDENDQNSLSDNAVATIMEDNSAQIWVGTSTGGVNRFDPVNQNFSHFKKRQNSRFGLSDNSIRHIYQSQDGMMWFATALGLDRLETTTGHVRHYGVAQGLASDNLKSIIGDKFGDLWISSSNGISKFDPGENSFVNYTGRNNFKDNSFLNNNVALGADNTIFFGSTDGLNKIILARMELSSVIPKTVITDVWVDDQRMKINYFKNGQILTFGHNTRRIEIGFATLDYLEPMKNSYSYKLTGLFDDWREPSKSRLATFTSLDPGRYQFSIKGSNSNNIWSTDIVTLTIIIETPWWQVWWAYSLYILAIIGLVNWFVHQQRNKEKQLKALVLARTTELEEHRDNLEGLVKEKTRDLVQSQEEAIATHEQLRHANKMEAVGQLAGGIAHDFNNILGIVMGHLELLQRLVVSDEKASNRVEKALKGAKRGAAMTKKLLGFSRLKDHQTALVSANEFIENMGDLLVKSLMVTVRIENHLANDLWLVNVDTDGLQDAILNLGINARDAMPNGGNLIIETSNKVLDTDFVKMNPESKIGEYVMLSVSDTGIGMTPEIKERVLEPFFTTKAEGKGTGLGLSMVYGFVKRSDGFITIYSEPGEGTSIRIFLPRGQEIKRLEATTFDKEIMPTGSETVLVVDDETELVEIAVANLEDLGYKTVVAFEWKSALKVIKDNSNIDLLFSDTVMPGELDGYELAIAANKIRPALKILLTSGFTKKREQASRPESSYIAELASKLLTKPYNKAELALAVRTVLDQKGRVTS